jgi:hypothetical protein
MTKKNLSRFLPAPVAGGNQPSGLQSALQVVAELKTGNYRRFASIPQNLLLADLAVYRGADGKLF